MDLAHPLRVAAGEVVVDGDEVDALAGDPVEIRRQRRHERLALTGLRLGDPAEVERGAAHELDVVVALADGPGRRLTHDGERLDQEVVDVGTVVEPLTELVGLGLECVVGQCLDFRTQRVDVRNDSFEGLDLLAFSSSEDAIEDSHAAIEPIGRLSRRGGAAAPPPASQRSGRPDGRHATAASRGRLTEAGVDATAYSMTVAAPADCECLRRMRHGGSGGHHVVDHDDPLTPHVGAGPEERARQTFTSGAAGLRTGVRLTVEQPTRRNAELRRDVAGEQFALVEPPFAAPRRARGRPRDHVDPGVIAVFDDLVDDETGEVPADLAAVPVLEPEHDIACTTRERHGGVDTVCLRSWASGPTRANRQVVHTGAPGASHPAQRVIKSMSSS